MTNTELMPLAERKAKIATHPRVRELKKAVPCDGLSAKRMGGWYHKDPAKRAAARERARCKNDAGWSFTYLKSSPFDQGRRNFCWNHLFTQGLMGNPDEDAAFIRWCVRKYGEE
jgi:hypothetical protein